MTRKPKAVRDRFAGLGMAMLVSVALVGCFGEEAETQTASDSEVVTTNTVQSSQDAPVVGARLVDGEEALLSAQACLANLPEADTALSTPALSTPARLTLSFEGMSYSFEEGRHRYTHDRRFRESAGVGVYIYRGKVCVLNGEECVDACVQYRVEPGDSLVQQSHHIASPVQEDQITVQYWARDDAGNVFTLNSTWETSDEQVTVVD